MIEVTRGKDKSCGTRRRHASLSGFWDPEGRGDIELLYIKLPVCEIALIVGSRESSRIVDFLWRRNLSIPTFIGTQHIGVHRSEGIAT